jgi:hypothetical protein
LWTSRSNDGRTALVLESAGDRTLAEDLAGGRRLALDLRVNLLEALTRLAAGETWLPAPQPTT